MEETSAGLLRETKRRAQTMGIAFLVFALLAILLFIPGVSGEQVTTFALDLPRMTDVWPIGSIRFNTAFGLYAMVLIMAVLGGVQLARGFKRAYMILGVVVTLFILTFLTWAARDASMNMTGMLQSTLLRAVPIVCAALSGVMCERCAIINIGIEGMMLSGAFMAALMGSVTQSAWGGLIAALLAGGLMGALLAVLAIKYKVNQIIAGTAINILATGLTSYFSSRYLQGSATLNNPPTFPTISIPLLSRLPVLGPVFFNNTFPVYLTLILVVVIHVMLFHTRWGLRTIAVGEKPRAADTLGVNVFLIRYVNTILGGMVAGLGGAYLVLSSVPRFDELMTAGRGFIGLAAMIFGKWMPGGALGASLIFGFADSLQTNLAILRVPIPSQFLLMAPYLATMIVLAGVVGRANAPAADGVPYEKE